MQQLLMAAANLLKSIEILLWLYGFTIATVLLFTVQYSIYSIKLFTTVYQCTRARYRYHRGDPYGPVLYE